MVKKLTHVSGVSISSLSEVFDRQNMDVIHKYAEIIIKYYISIIGFYPQTSLVINSGDLESMGGFPNSLGEITIHNLPAYDAKNMDWWKWIVAHEIGHMYWGFYVLDGDKKVGSELGWLTIGLGLYLDRKFSLEMNLKHSEYIEMDYEYKKALLIYPKIDFGMDKEYEKIYEFDYNYAINHGKALNYILELEKSLNPKRFWKFYLYLLRLFADKYITQGLLEISMERWLAGKFYNSL